VLAINAGFTDLSAVIICRNFMKSMTRSKLSLRRGHFSRKRSICPVSPLTLLMRTYIINENIHNLKSFMLTLRSMTIYSFRKGQKWLPVFVLSLFLLSVLAMAFHHHEDGLSHDDCPLCIAAYHSYSIQQNDHCRYVPWTACTRIVINQEPLLYNSSHFSLTPFRSPPA
jgi:hypothetical protein